jgi:hypothetical protein
MTEQEYAAIAAACDRLLRAPGTDLARLAIPELHLLNEHPSWLAQYAPVLVPRAPARHPDPPGTALRLARSLLRSLTARPLAPAPHGPIDVIIVSHLIRPEQLHRSDDFYFGALQSQFAAQGATSLLVLISHLRDAPRVPNTAPHLPRLILTDKVSAATELRIWRSSACAGRRLRREAAAARDGIDRRLALLASRQACSPATLTNLRMHAAIAGLCQAVNPKVVLTTYEGTVAERLIWQGARTARRRPLCVGYQHAMVHKRAHAIRRSVAAPGLDCDPDVILTLGTLPHALLAASTGLQSVRLIAYGSHRRATMAPQAEWRTHPRCCLVMPDAGEQECVKLFDFALRCASLDPTLRFALRPHPMADIGSLLRRHPQWRRLPENVSLSAGKPAERDFAQARYCLYRGSSAALHAVRAGIKPFYLESPGELPFDCLFELDQWRETVTTPQQLIERIRAADSSVDSLAARRAASVCERYVAPIRPAALDELLALAPS